MTNKNGFIDKILAEVAEELHINTTTVAAVYNHFLSYIEKAMTEIKLKYMDKEFIKKHAININVPGFGKILNKYGKTIRSRKKDNNS